MLELPILLKEATFSLLVWLFFVRGSYHIIMGIFHMVQKFADGLDAMKITTANF